MFDPAGRMFFRFAHRRFHLRDADCKSALEIGHLTVMNRATADFVPHFVAHFVVNSGEGMKSEPQSGTPPDPIEQAIFNAARDLTQAEARGAFLDRACGSDSALRLRIEALLAADARAGQFFSDDPLGLDQKSGTVIAAPSVPPAEPVGTRIGRYKLLEKIGEGGMGVARFGRVQLVAHQRTSRPAARRRRGTQRQNRSRQKPASRPLSSGHAERCRPGSGVGARHQDAAGDSGQDG